MRGKMGREGKKISATVLVRFLYRFVGARQSSAVVFHCQSCLRFQPAFVSWLVRFQGLLAVARSSSKFPHTPSLTHFAKSRDRHGIHYDHAPLAKRWPAASVAKKLHHHRPSEALFRLAPLPVSFFNETRKKRKEVERKPPDAI